MKSSKWWFHLYAKVKERVDFKKLFFLYVPEVTLKTFNRSRAALTYPVWYLNHEAFICGLISEANSFSG